MQVQKIGFKETSSINVYDYKSTKTQKTSNCDVVAFSGIGRLLSKYKINPAEIPVVSTSDITIGLKEKTELIQRILEAHEHAAKNRLTGNIAGAGYATNMGLSNGLWTLATNFNNTRNEISAVCGERSSTLGLFNKWLRSLSLSRLQKDAGYRDLSQQGSAFKVRYLAMSSFKEIGTDKNAASPCTDCLSWLNTERFFDDSTRIVSLEKDAEGQLCLKMRTVKESLPYRHEKESLIKGTQTLNELGYAITPKALEVMEKSGISQESVLQTLNRAKEAYDTNKCTAFSSQNVGAAVFDNNGKITTGKKVDWGKRWFMEPLELAISKAVEDAPNETKIKAVAYYGQGIVNDKGITHQDGVVSLQTLGRLKTDKGNSETLVISVIDDKITVRTIDDYMPEKFSFVQQYLQQKK